DHQICGDVSRTIGCADANTDYAPRTRQKFDDFGFHEEMEGRQFLRFAGDEVEKLPLRHENHEFAARRQLREVADSEAVLAELGGDFVHFVVRTGEERIDQAELDDELERRGMNRVAAKIAQEV